MKSNIQYLIALLATLLAFNHSTQAQQVALDWAGTTLHEGWNAETWPCDLIVKENGSVVGTGRFEPGVDLDPGPESYFTTSQGYYVRSLDSEGQLQWVQTLSASSGFGHYQYISGKFFSVDADSEGNLFLAGSFAGELTLDTQADVILAESEGGFDVFMMKLDANGSLVWIKTYGGPDDVLAQSLAVSNAGFCIGGDFQGTVDLDPSSEQLQFASNGDSDIFLQEFDSEGNLLFGATFGGLGQEKLAEVEFSEQQNLFVGGLYSGTVDFSLDGGSEMHTSVGQDDIFLLKLNQAQEIQWLRSLGGIGNGYLSDIKIDHEESVLASIRAPGGQVPFDLGGEEFTFTSYTHHSVIAKLDNTGQTVFGFTAANTFTITPRLSGGFFVLTEDSYSNYELPVASDSGFIIAEYGPDGSLLHADALEVYDENAGEGPNNGKEIIYHEDNIYISISTMYCIDLDPLSDTQIICPDPAFDDIPGTIVAKYSVCKAGEYEPVNEVLTALSGDCEIGQPIYPRAVDACGTEIFGTTDTEFPITNTGETTIIWSYQNDDGSIVTQEQIAIIEDDVAPQLQTPNLEDIFFCDTVFDIEKPLANDNCDGVIEGQSDPELPLAGPGTYEVTWTFTDESGNSTQQSQTVVVGDFEPPTPLDAELPTVTTVFPYTPISPPSAFDDCIGVVTAVTDTDWPVTTPGSTSVTWIYDDGFGNISTQVQEIFYAPIDVTVTEGEDSFLSIPAEGYDYQWLDCEQDYAPIEGANERTFLPMNGGSFAVQVSNEAGTVISDCYEVFGTAIENYDFYKETVVSPNPCKGMLNIQSARPDMITQMQLTDVSGRSIKCQYSGIQSNLKQLQFEPVPGIYLLQLWQENRLLEVKKIVVY